MSTTFDAIIERIISAHNGSDRHHGKMELLYYKGQVSSEEFQERVKTCIPKFVRRMSDNRGNGSFQEGCNEVLVAFFNNGCPVIKELNSSFKQNTDDMAMARTCLEIFIQGKILYYADNNNGSWFPSVLTDGFMPALVDTMNRHEDDHEIQELAIDCICRFADKADTEMRSHLSTAVIRSMRIHSDRARVQMLGCNVLGEYDMAAVAAEWPPVTVLQAMNNHVLDNGVQTAACLFLRRVSVGGGGDRRAALSGQAFIQAVLQALQNHPNDGSVLEDATVFLGNLLGEATASRIVEGGGVQVFLTRLHNFSTPSLHSVIPPGISWALGILLYLFKNNPHARSIAIAEDGIGILIESLTHPLLLKTSERSSAMKVYRMLNQLVLESGDTSVGAQLAARGSIKAIVNTVVYVAVIVSSFRLTDNDVLAQLATFTCSNGALPLHYAVSCGWGGPGKVAVIEHLLTVYPEAVSTCDDEGRLPLHVAVESKASLSVVECLLRAYPGATKVHDGKDRLPLLVAVEVNASLEVLDALLGVDPSSGEAPYKRRNDTMVNFPPLLMAAANNCDLDIIFTLLCAFPTILKRRCQLPVSRKRKCCA